MSVLSTLGYSKKTTEYALDPENYCIIQADELSESETHRTRESKLRDQIAVIALRKGQTVMLPFAHGLHDIQRNSLFETGYTTEQIDFLDEEFAIRPAIAERSPGTHTSASLHTQLAKFEQLVMKETSSIQSRPTIVLHVDERRMEDQDGPDAILHEIVHGVQALDRPLYIPGQRLNHELEAYAVQAKTISSLELPYTNNTAMAVMVDSFRRRNLGADYYQATTDFEEKILADPFLRKII